MNPCARLLDRLELVRKTAPDRRIARCPAHADKGPSLSIREGESGKLLVHCFAGCDTYDVLAAVGLTYRDLYPEGRRESLTNFGRSRIPAADLILMLDEDVTVVDIAAASLLESKSLTEEDWALLAEASRRIGQAAAEVRRTRPWRPGNVR